VKEEMKKMRYQKLEQEKEERKRRLIEAVNEINTKGNKEEKSFGTEKVRQWISLIRLSIFLFFLGRRVITTVLFI